MTTTRRNVRTTPGGSAGNTTRNWIIIAAVVVGIAGLGYLLYLNVRPEQPIAGVVAYPRPSRGHDNAIQYEYGGLPPVGGVHHDTWQNCGIYAEPILAENAVHSLEHGAVWITYHPDLSSDQIETLRDKARGQDFVLLSPWPDQTSLVALTAWGVQLEVAAVDDSRVDEFIEKYQVGPQTPERGATCQRGTGVPTE